MEKELNEKILPIYDDILFLTEIQNPQILSNYLENAQIILFVYLKSDINAENKQLLQNLITACKVVEAQVQFLEIDLINDFIKLFPHLLAKKIVLFGISLESDILSTAYIQHYLFEFKGKKLVQTSSLTELNTNQELKKILWNNGLKPMFDV